MIEIQTVYIDGRFYVPLEEIQQLLEAKNGTAATEDRPKRTYNRKKQEEASENGEGG